MPKNTGTGVILAGLSTVCGLAMIWYIWWLAAIAFVGVLATAIWHSFNYDRDFHIPVEDIRRHEDARTEALARAEV